MNQKLSFQAFATTLAALGLAACGGSAPAAPAESPVEAKEVPAATEASAPGTTPAAPDATSSGATPAAPDSTTPAAPAAPAADATPAPKPEEKPADAAAPKPAAKKKAAGAKGGCGAGTCG